MEGTKKWKRLQVETQRSNKQLWAIVEQNKMEKFYSTTIDAPCINACEMRLEEQLEMMVGNELVVLARTHTLTHTRIHNIIDSIVDNFYPFCVENEAWL
mmetsp:Transcript_2715/g.3933  ORF Transcript_2715/g.3933 Transcript_2715/m.3933 type:complete len:99 (+) Transcript_2715:104-400(+)